MPERVATPIDTGRSACAEDASRVEIAESSMEEKYRASKAISPHWTSRRNSFFHLWHKIFYRRSSPGIPEERESSVRAVFPPLSRYSGRGLGGEGFLLPSPGTPGEGSGREGSTSPHRVRGATCPHPQPLSRSTGRGGQNRPRPAAPSSFTLPSTLHRSPSNLRLVNGGATAFQILFFSSCMFNARPRISLVSTSKLAGVPASSVFSPLTIDS